MIKFNKTMMLLQLLLAAVAVAGDRVVVNRRARQRQRQVTPAPAPQLPSASDFSLDTDRRFRVQNAFSLALANSDGFGFGAETIYGQNYSSEPSSYYEVTTTEVSVTQARVPRRRTQLTRGRGQARSAPRSAEVRSEAPGVTRSRARIPRRRVNPNRDLERNERNTLSVETDTAVSPRRLSNNILDTTDTGRSAAKSRSRSRFRSRVSAPATTARPGYTPASGRGRGRTISRGAASRPRTDNTALRAAPGDSSDRKQAPKKTTLRPSSAKVIFPRKNLFPKLNKYSITQGANEVDTGSFVGSDNYKLTKERLKSSLTKVRT